MSEFISSPSFVRVIMGPVGSGKSVCCINELMHLAILQKPNKKGVRKSITLIVRNTADQLRSTTMKTFFDWFPPGEVGTWRASEKLYLVDQPLADGTRLHAEFMFIALDTPDDVRKALSLEATFLYGNEWRELHPVVVSGLLMRLRRYPSKKDGGFTRSCAVFDTNMPDMDTWHHKMTEAATKPDNWSVHIQPPAVLSHAEYVTRYKCDPQDIEYPADDAASATGPVIYQNAPISDSNKNEWYINPGADNLFNLDKQYYPDIIPGKTDDFINVYLRCQYGRSLSGLPVYDKTFSHDTHVPKATRADPFRPIQSVKYPVVIGLDFGRTPAAVFGQRNTKGRVIVLDELTSENMGIETFIKTKLKPLIAAKYAGCSIVVAPDPAGWAKQQIGEISPVDVLKKEGFKVQRPVTNDPELRVQCVERLLAQMVEGEPALQINAHCTMLIQGFRYGYRYALNRKGMQDNKPDKNEFSHCHDAIQYMALVIEGTPVGSATAKKREIKQVEYCWA